MAFKIGKNGVQLVLPDVITASAWELLVELVGLGALVSIGASKDRGAVSITVTVGGEWDREWFRIEEDVLSWLQEAVVVVRELQPEPSPPSRSTRRR